MKYFKILTILLCLSTVVFYSCKDNTKTPEPQEESTTKEPVKELGTPTNNTTTTKNNNTVYHYICDKGCISGSEAAGTCSVCGNILTHNQAYHNNNRTVMPTTNTPNTNVTQQAEPSQNAAGIWHYTCNKGCAGGSGAAGNCSTCGNALAHNGAYHQ